MSHNSYRAIVGLMVGAITALLIPICVVVGCRLAESPKLSPLVQEIRSVGQSLKSPMNGPTDSDSTWEQYQRMKRDKRFGGYEIQNKRRIRDRRMNSEMKRGMREMERMHRVRELNRR